MSIKCIVSMQKSIYEYKAILFDVDGTLYMQRGLRLAMAKALAKYFLLHPSHIRELLALIKYRQIREHWEDICHKHFDNSLTPVHNSQGLADMEMMQYQYTATKLHMTSGQVKDTVHYWMHFYPLSILARYKDKELCLLLERMREQGTVIAAYSDYPASEKLKALQIRADYVFCSSDDDINCMKPHPKAVQIILEKLDLSGKEVLMIGDRYSKDGLAAINSGMDYLILGTSMSRRCLVYKDTIDPAGSFPRSVL